MKQYRYETHLHTYEASLCAKSMGAEYPAYYKNLGYDGIFVTDHFFNGNTRIPSYDSWERRVHEFCLGYEHAKAAGDAIGFPVFFGWEANFDGDEFLIYGLDKEWLLKHPDLLSWSRTEQYDVIHADGGLVVQAHPFRERSYLTAIRLNPDTCDAWESYNSCNETVHNNNAELYCLEHDIFMTGGSDIHLAGSISGERLSGMAFDRPLASSSDYVNAVLNRRGRVIMPESEHVRAENGAIRTKLPVFCNHREFE